MGDTPPGKNLSVMECPQEDTAVSQEPGGPPRWGTGVLQNVGDPHHGGYWSIIGRKGPS